MRTKHPTQTGDTLIEVLLAFAVLGILIVIGYTVMSRGTAIMYNSLDRSNVQAIINGQAAALRAYNQLYLTTSDSTLRNTIKQNIYDKAKTYASSVAMTAAEQDRSDGCKSGVADNTQKFYFYYTNAFGPSMTLLGTVPTTYDTQPERKNINPTAGDGIWIEGYKITLRTDGTFDPNTYTFYIKSCNAPTYGDGSDILRQNKTVVRLYAP